MTRYLFLLLMSCYILCATAQVSRPVQLVHYALDSFSAGKVLMKSGSTSEQQLNYNLVTGEMIFQQNGRFMAIASPQEVDTVYVSNRKFVPAGEHFYEWLTGHDPTLFEEYTCSVKEPGAETGFGKTNTSATASMNTLVKSGGAYELKLPDDFKVIPSHNFWIRKDGKLFKVNNAQQMGKAFPDKKDWIGDWMKKNNASFSKQEDLINLVKALQPGM